MVPSVPIGARQTVRELFEQNATDQTLLTLAAANLVLGFEW